MRNTSKIKFKGLENGLVIHHWDTDGICSAVLLLEKLRESGVDKIDTMSPVIGNFFLTDDEIGEISKRNYEFISIVDVCFPRENVLKIKEKTGAAIFIFDHHLQEEITEVNHFNPLCDGEDGDAFPSASWLLTKIFKLPVNLMSVLGAIGDMGGAIKENEKIYPEIKAYLKDNGIFFKDALEMTRLIDSNYKVGDKKGVEESVFFLMKNGSSPERILENKDWQAKENDLKNEIEKQLSKERREIGNSIILDIDTNYNIISTITRKLALENPKKIVVVINHGFFRGSDQVYVRGDGAHHLVETARSLGYSAGGKKGVAGIVVPKDKTNWFVENMIKGTGQEI